MIDGKIIKVCGMREAENIRQVEQSGIDWMGFIFYPPSPRALNQRPAYLPAQVKRIGVFVNEQPTQVLRLVEDYALDFVQLHGSESPDDCRLIRQKVPVIKTLSIATETDLEAVETYIGCCDYLLFDTRCPTHGGSGATFDWSILAAYRGTTPFLLSGGLRPESVEALRRFSHPQLAGYDLNSGFETAPGLKDPARITQFINQLFN
jgi:phosphoribosylanthranilate isomerase